MNPPPFPAWLAAGMTALVLTGAAAESPAAPGDGDYALDEIVVTATRRVQRAIETPYAVSVRNQRDLQLVRQVRTIPDALRDLPGIMVQKTGHGQGSPFIRGFTGQRTLFMIDGVRLNNSVFRDGPNQYWNSVDPLSAHRLEIVRGPSSVLYGSDAIGGTVNMLTRPLAIGPLTPQSQFTSYARLASAEESLVLRPQYSFGNEHVSSVVAVSLKDFGDLHGGREIGEQPKTGYGETDGDLRIEYALASNQRLVAAFQTVRQNDAWRVHKTVHGISWRGTTVGNEQERSLDQDRQLAYLQYRADQLSPWLTSFTASLSHHRQEEFRRRVRADGRRDEQGFDVTTTGFFTHGEIPSRAGTWTVGVEHYRDSVDSGRIDYNADGSLRGIRIQGPVADDASYESTAIFVQNQFPLGDATVLTAGLRYNDNRADARRVQHPQTGLPVRIRDDWQATTASLRFNHLLTADGGLSLFGGLSQGFRAPNLSDLTRYDSARSNEIETPVTDLDAERFLSTELGVKFISGNASGQVSVFHTNIDDMIIRTPTGATIDGANEVTKRNSGEGFARGIEGQLSYAIDERWRVFGNATWLDGEIDTYPTSSPVAVREPLSRLMPVTVSAGVRHTLAGEGRWVELHLSHAARADRLSSRDRSDTDRIPAGGTPGYTIVSLRSGWRISDSLDVAVALENLLDEDYRVHGSGVNEPGRNLVATVIWSPR